jgi:hypothetical protein
LVFDNLISSRVKENQYLYKLDLIISNQDISNKIISIIDSKEILKGYLLLSIIK